MSTFNHLCEDKKSKKCFALKWIIWRIIKDSIMTLIVFSYRHDFILTEFDETELLSSNYLLQGRFISSFYLEWHLIYYYVNYLNLIHATIFPRQEYNNFQPIIWGRHWHSCGKSEYSWYYAIYLAFMYGTL